MPADVKKVLSNLKPYFRADGMIQLTPPQQELVNQNTRRELDEVTVGCFNFEQLGDEHHQSLSEYFGLSSPLTKKGLLPFGLLNGYKVARALEYDENPFQESNNVGVLCLNVKDGRAGDGPVVWVYRGDVHPWASSIDAVGLEVPDDEDEEGLEED